MLEPIESFERLIDEGISFLQEDKVLIGRSYHDLLFYRTSLNNLNAYIARQ